MKTTATLTIRNVPMRIVKGLKSLARRRGRSMEQEVRSLLEEHVADRTAVLRSIRESWSRQARRPTASEIDRWIETGRR
jgi:plasmid stability protein